MTTFKEFMNDLSVSDNMVLGTPPRQGKSFMSKAMASMYESFKSAFDEAYSHVFNEIKEDSEGFYSDKEIHDFIEKYITFELEVEDKGFTETPTIVITPKMKEFDIEEL